MHKVVFDLLNYTDLSPNHFVAAARHTTEADLILLHIYGKEGRFEFHPRKEQCYMIKNLRIYEAQFIEAYAQGHYWKPQPSHIVGVLDRQPTKGSTRSR
jgi:hypothetical protein